MYPQVDKGSLPSAPPVYSESVGAPNYGPQYPPQQQPQYPPQQQPQYPPQQQPQYPPPQQQYPPPQYAPPQYSHQQAQPGGQQATHMVVVQAAQPIPPLGSRSVEVTCPSCKSVVMSSVMEESSNQAYLCCMLMCLFGLFPCCCLPFCMDTFKTYTHTCPRCQTFFGNYRP